MKDYWNDPDLYLNNDAEEDECHKCDSDLCGDCYKCTNPSCENNKGHQLCGVDAGIK